MSQPRHEPLAHLALASAQAQPEEAGATLQALPYRPSVILRGESGDKAFPKAAAGGLGFDLPVAANHAAGDGGVTAYWLGPSEWQLLGLADTEDLTQALAETRHAIIENADGQQAIALSGHRARDVLAKLCPLDLEDPGLVPGRCARTVLAGCTVLLVPREDGAYHIHVARSFADYVWRMLAEAGSEFGVRVAQ
ncbi:MAG: sarcosine oxidase subunit gamma family protein [Alphaproteobacteria bacterium]|nr:sarcosine oxidase subunit gamma family protein [Alphaproteobacteria bacterium]